MGVVWQQWESAGVSLAILEVHSGFGVVLFGTQSQDVDGGIRDRRAGISVYRVSRKAV